MRNINTVAFPGLGIGEFDMNRVAFNLVGRNVTWYGIITTAAIAIAVVYFLRIAKKDGYRTDDILDMFLFAVPCGILGGRLYFIAFTPGFRADGIIDALAFWNGGIAIYGVIIGAALSGLISAKVKKVRLARVLDCAIPAVLLGQILGRWANFVNVEVYGMTTTLPWRMVVPSSTPYGVHPIFIYESLWNLLGLTILLVLMKKKVLKKKFDGQFFCIYVAWYGIGRGFIEMLRGTGFVLSIGPFRVSSLIGFGSAIIAIGIMIFFLRKGESPALKEQPYYPTSKHYKTEEL
ncbi:MAG: prolipoprotein diacylglyceryl transferase [Oscillospiraceae bacterium]|nr:prolipoprotein diacylglyceryl transferase [Oscillospiraceae bacterium]